MELPFELRKYHKTDTKGRWKIQGMICTEEEFESYYAEYIYLSNCDLCGEFFKSSKDRQMEHNHENGVFRNFVCTSCNTRKDDVKIRTTNKSGYVGISKHIDKRYKQGFRWKFEVSVDGKTKQIKSSVDKEKLNEFAIKWKIDNNYNT